MIRSNFFSRFIVVTLTAALLLVSGSRAICVSALAEIAPEVAPVFDTQIYQLQDYINEGMTEPQYEVFCILLGSLAVAQAGFTEYKLVDPFTTRDGIVGWLKSTGITVYNTIIGTGFGVDPLTGVDYRPYLKVLIANAMGAAVVAANYTDVNDFLDDVDNSDHFYLQIGPDLQKAINIMYETNGGMYEWQFNRSEWSTNIPYVNYVLTGVNQTEYNTYIANVGLVNVRQNQSTLGNIRWSKTEFWRFTNLFINYTNHSIQLLDDNGTFYSGDADYGSKRVYVERYNTNPPTYSVNYHEPYFPNNYQVSFDPSQYSTANQLIQDVYDGEFNLLGTSDQFFFLEDFVTHVYYGSSWSDKIEVYNDTDLNIAESMANYYLALQDEHLLDFKGLLLDLLNQHDLINVILDNLFDRDGVRVYDPQLIKITTDIYNLLEDMEPALPVNLNDIAELTDNTYLDRVKEHARNASDIFANYVAFWHNCDSDLVYTMFGSAILVLVGAFVGKWGHS